MATEYKVELLSKGGGSRKTIFIKASDPTRAKQQAESIANAEAAAQKAPYTYYATSVNQA
jgi:hypothetical protein